MSKTVNLTKRVAQRLKIKSALTAGVAYVSSITESVRPIYRSSNNMAGMARTA